MPTGRMRGRAHDQPHDSGHALRVPDANRNACAEYGSGGGVVTGDIPSGQIRELLDKQAITEQLSAYCRGVDRIDLDLIRSVFHPGAIADYGTMFTGTGHEFADFIGQVHPPMSAHSHLIGSISITVSGDIAGSESYVLARLRFTGADALATDTVTQGRYLDEWQRIDGIWRISHRRYLHTLDETRVVERPMMEPSGTRDGSDPSYDILRPGKARS